MKDSHGLSSTTNRKALSAILSILPADDLTFLVTCTYASIDYIRSMLTDKEI